MEKIKAIGERWLMKANRRYRIVPVLTKRHWDSVEEMNQDTKYLTRINLILIVANTIIFFITPGSAVIEPKMTVA